MDNFLPNSFLGWASTLLFVVAGVFAVFGIIDNNRRKTHKDGDEADDRLNSILKETVAALEGKVKTLQDSDLVKSKQISKLEGKNEIYEALFQGRDKQTLEFQKQGFEIMKQAKVSFETLNNVNQQLATTNSNIERLATAIEKHLETFTPKTTVKTTRKVELVGK